MSVLSAMNCRLTAVITPEYSLDHWLLFAVGFVAVIFVALPTSIAAGIVVRYEQCFVIHY